MGEQYRERRAFPLATGGEGFLARDGSRAIATLTDVKRIDVRREYPLPAKLRDLCVATDGKTTIATTQESGEAARLWVADSFDGQLRPVGSYLAEIRREYGDANRERPVWIVRDEKDTRLVNCESGTIERVAPAVAWASLDQWSDALQILELRTHKPESTYCMIRTRESSSWTPWTKQPDCSIRSRADGSIAVETLVRQPRAQPKCAFVLDEYGKKQRCDTPIGSAKRVDMSAIPRPGESPLQGARFYAPSEAVLPGLDGALFRLGVDGKISDVRVGLPSLKTCTPLLPTLPVFRCVSEDRFDVVVNVDSSGQAREELKRPKPESRDEVAGRAEGLDAAFHVTADGGVAVGGDCSGNLGNVACVRDANGTWREVQFSKELTTALTRTAPATRLIPTPEGQLFVGAGTSEGLLGGNVQVLLFRADQGPGKVIEKIPAWILGSLSGMRDLASMLGSSGGPSVGPSLAWSTSQRVRVWPLERQHPAFHTKEFCRVDIALDGTFDAECVQGRLFAVGRLGLWEKRPGEIYETLDAAQSWTPVALPKGIEGDDIVCSSLGCRIGPLWRMGWGPGTAVR